jgi:hypothetical protein
MTSEYQLNLLPKIFENADPTGDLWITKGFPDPLLRLFR